MIDFDRDFPCCSERLPLSARNVAAASDPRRDGQAVGY